MKSIYKNQAAKEEVFKLYEEKLQRLDIPYEEIDVQSSFGRTRVIQTGNKQGKKIVLFHGIHAGAPLTLEAVKELGETYQLIAIDTIGQATKSAENIIDINDQSFAIWADEVLDQLSIQEANFIGISYGAFILQKLMSFRPKKIAKAILVVPAGIVNGAMWPSLTKLTFPLFRFLISKKDKHLKSFIKAFVPEDDEFMFRMQKALLLGVNMDFRRPGLIQKKDMAHFSNPVHMIVADDDIFFPGDAAVKKAKQVYPNLKEVHYIKNCKHMPHKRDYPEIQQMIAKWIG